MKTLTFEQCVNFCVREYNEALTGHHPESISTRNPQGKSASTIMCEAVDKASVSYGHNWCDLKRAAEAQL